jgi:transposase
LRDIFKKGIVAARRALDRWLAAASRSKLEHFVKMARTIREFRDKIEATIKFGYNNGISTFAVLRPLAYP